MEGGSTSKVYFIETGTLQSLQNNKGRQQVERISAPSAVRLDDVIGGTAYTATVRCLTECKLFVMPQADFLSLTSSSGAFCGK